MNFSVCPFQTFLMQGAFNHYLIRVDPPGGTNPAIMLTLTQEVRLFQGLCCWSTTKPLFLGSGGAAVVGCCWIARCCAETAHPRAHTWQSCSRSGCAEAAAAC